jgi:hypothetical protein
LSQVDSGAAGKFHRTESEDSDARPSSRGVAEATRGALPRGSSHGGPDPRRGWSHPGRKCRTGRAVALIGHRPHRRLQQSNSQAHWRDRLGSCLQALRDVGNGRLLHGGRRSDGASGRAHWVAIGVGVRRFNEPAMRFRSLVLHARPARIRPQRSPGARRSLAYFGSSRRTTVSFDVTAT